MFQIENSLLSQKIVDDTPLNSKNDSQENLTDFDLLIREQKLENSINSLTNELAELTESLGKAYKLEPEIIQQATFKLAHELKTELREIVDNEKFVMLIQKAKIVASKYSTKVSDLLTNLTQNDLLLMLERKFSNQLRDNDILVLQMLLLAQHGRAVHGTHDSLSDDVRLILLTPADKSEMKKTFLHELSHLALANISKQSDDIAEDSDLKKNIFEKNSEYRLLFQFLKSFDESVAHLVANYGETVSTSHIKYYNKTIPEILHTEVFTKLVDLRGYTTNLVEFIEMSQEIYRQILAAISKMKDDQDAAPTMATFEEALKTFYVLCKRYQLQNTAKNPAGSVT